MITRELCSFIVRAIVYIRAFVIFCCVRSFLESFMPQQLNVLRCYSCKMYQVHIAKKSRKWQCKICNEKQSIRTICYRGTGVECRNYVQTRNIIAASADEAKENFPTAVIDGWGLDCEADDSSVDPCDCGQRKMAIAKFADNFNDRDDSPENTNASGPRKRPRVDSAEKRSQSVPVGDSLLPRDARSQSFPQSARTRLTSKWDKFLQGGETQFSSQPVNKPEVYEENREDTWSKVSSVAGPPDEGDEETSDIGHLKASQVDSDTASSASGHISNDLFVDSNDELDIDLDF